MNYTLKEPNLRQAESMIIYADIEKRYNAQFKDERGKMIRKGSKALSLPHHTIWLELLYKAIQHNSFNVSQFSTNKALRARDIRQDFIIKNITANELATMTGSADNKRRSKSSVSHYLNRLSQVPISDTDESKLLKYENGNIELNSKALYWRDNSDDTEHCLYENVTTLKSKFKKNKGAKCELYISNKKNNIISNLTIVKKEALQGNATLTQNTRATKTTGTPKQPSFDGRNESLEITVTPAAAPVLAVKIEVTPAAAPVLAVEIEVTPAAAPVLAVEIEGTPAAAAPVLAVEIEGTPAASVLAEVESENRSSEYNRALAIYSRAAYLLILIRFFDFGIKNKVIDVIMKWLKNPILCLDVETLDEYIGKLWHRTRTLYNGVAFNCLEILSRDYFADCVTELDFQTRYERIEWSVIASKAHVTRNKDYYKNLNFIFPTKFLEKNEQKHGDKSTMSFWNVFHNWYANNQKRIASREITQSFVNEQLEAKKQLNFKTLVMVAILLINKNLWDNYGAQVREFISVYMPEKRATYNEFMRTPELVHKFISEFSYTQIDMNLLTQFGLTKKDIETYMGSPAAVANRRQCERDKLLNELRYKFKNNDINISLFLKVFTKYFAVDNERKKISIKESHKHAYEEQISILRNYLMAA